MRYYYIIFLLIFSVPILMADTSINPLTKGYADILYCAKDGSNCPLGNVTYDLNVSGNSGEGLIEDTEILSIIGLDNITTSMSGNTLSISFNGSLVGFTDTNETVRFDNLVAVDCGGTDKVTGVDPNGTVLCSADIDTDTDTIYDDGWINTTIYDSNQSAHSYADNNFVNKTDYATNTTAMSDYYLGLSNTTYYDGWINGTIEDANTSVALYCDAQIAIANYTNVQSYNLSWCALALGNDTIARIGDCSDGYAVQNTTTGGVECVALAPVSETFNASIIVTVKGTESGGNSLSNITSYDGLTYNVTEATGANPLDIRINFTGITTFDSFVMRERYIGGNGHEMIVYLWDYTLSDWQQYMSITDQGSLTISNTPVLDPSDHVSGGIVQWRINHVQNGLTSHKFMLDYIALQKGTTTLVNAEHDSLSGRDDFNNNHPEYAERLVELGDNLSSVGNWSKQVMNKDLNMSDYKLVSTSTIVIYLNSSIYINLSSISAVINYNSNYILINDTGVFGQG